MTEHILAGNRVDDVLFYHTKSARVFTRRFFEKVFFYLNLVITS